MFMANLTWETKFENNGHLCCLMLKSTTLKIVPKIMICFNPFRITVCNT